MSTRAPSFGGSNLRAVLGPTNTGKTHLAIERLCAHSSGAIGFPLRLLAREVYDKVCAIKGADQVALITGEERIEPKNARWLLCTAEAMPRGADLAFVALDEAQLGADRERGHIFTDRLLHMRGREETMLLGSATLAPMVRSLLPEAEIISRPRFSTLSHGGAKKLSRLPPRSAIVAFSVEQVYAIAEMLRRFRGGSAVVMGALSPRTRNAQVAMFQSGEVDYLVATDAIGMGLNLDLDFVAFAGLSKFDGVRQRRLTIAEMAQIAGRAGRHQRDGSFGSLAGTGGHDAAFTDEEVYAIEEHRFAPLAHLFWREAEPRFDHIEALIMDLERLPDHPALRAAPEALDLQLVKRLSDQPAIAETLRGAGAVQRFWEVCSLPDFRSLGPEHHGQFVSRLWDDLRDGGQLGADFVARKIAELDVTGGDVDTLGGRIAAIRSWAYITQRPDWVLARDEMAQRARAVEARLSDALHARLTERFVNRRNLVLMRKTGVDAGLLPVTVTADDRVLVDGEDIGGLLGLRFTLDVSLRADERKLLLAAAEKHLPKLLQQRIAALVALVEADDPAMILGREDFIGGGPAIIWQAQGFAQQLARLGTGRNPVRPLLIKVNEVQALDPAQRDALMAALAQWLDRKLTGGLGPLCAMVEASQHPESGSALRALLAPLTVAGGVLHREVLAQEIGLLDEAQRQQLRQLGVRLGRLDLWHPAMLRPAAAKLWLALDAVERGNPAMPPVTPLQGGGAPFGYRRAGDQALRVDMAERIIEALEQARGKRWRFAVDPALAISMGLTVANLAALLRDAGYHASNARRLAEGAAGPPAPTLWNRARPKAQRGGRAKPVRKLAPQHKQAALSPPPVADPNPAADSPFAALAGLLDQPVRR